MMTQAQDFFLKTLQTAVNHYLSLDPESLARIKPLKNKIVKIELLQMRMGFYLTFVDNGLQVDLATAADTTIKVDTVIQGTPLRLLHMALSGEKRQQFFADDVSIQGSLELGQEVIYLFDHVEIDWEEQLSHYIGDVPAHYLGRMARQLQGLGKKTRAALIQNVTEYVHEEIPLFPPSEALRDFFHDVDQLRMDVDRLEASLTYLQKQVVSKRGEM